MKMSRAPFGSSTSRKSWSKSSARLALTSWSSATFATPSTASQRVLTGRERVFRSVIWSTTSRSTAKEDDKLLEDCFNGALESLCPIPLKQRKRFRWKVRIAKSKHSGETTLFFRWGIRTKVTFEVKVARVRRIDKPTQPQLEVFEGDAV
jgi:hypothetical protein